VRRPAAVGAGRHRRSSRSCTRSVGIAALLLVAPLAACSASETATPPGSPDALARIHRSVARTEAAGTAHLDSSSDLTAATSKEPERRITSVGDIRFAGPDLSITTTIQSLPSSIGARTSTTSQAIYLGRHVFFGSPPPDSTWTETTPHAPYPFVGAVTTQLLEHTEGPVTVVGHGQVDGKAATEYHVPVPASTQAIHESDSHNRPFTGHVHFAHFVAAVWLDGNGRIVRTSATVVATSSQNRGAVRQSSTTTLSAFGEPVHIVAPSVVVHN
jgi:hypothetical protein